MNRTSTLFALNKVALYNKVGRYKQAILYAIDFLDKNQNVSFTLHLDFYLISLSVLVGSTCWRDGQIVHGIW